MEKVTALEGAKIADAVYGNKTTPFLAAEGYRLAIDDNTKLPITFSDLTTDLQMALYQNIETGNYIVAFRGTSSVADLVTDLGMGISTYLAGLADQFTPAGITLSDWIGRFGLSTSNTTIVGHSLGGSLAQYFGATTGFETLTYNAYGMGSEISGGSNITNYITMHDPVSSLPRSIMIGITFMLQDENLYALGGHGLSNFTSVDQWVKGYSRVNAPQDIDVIDGIGSSGLDSAYEAALLLLEGRRFAMISGSMDDIIYGDDKIDNILIGGGGKDTLYGMGGSDMLKGGADFDTYIAGNSDIITDSDGKGRVYFEGKLLTGGEARAGQDYYIKPDGSRDYVGNGGVYTLSAAGVLTFKKDSGEILVIEEFTNDNLGIHLEGKTAPEHSCPSPVNPLFSLNLHLPTPTRSASSSNGTSGSSRSYSGSYSHYTPSTPHRTPTPPVPDIPCPHVDYYNSAGTGGGPGSTGPIVLDLNRNGITSISLAASIALFDYDGDGIKENTAWTENTDALLVNDINQDGLINNASELFGNYTKNSDGSIAKSGYQALSYYDTNSDGVVNATDTRFNELKLWIDGNGDGITDQGELKTLSEMGVTSLTLNNPTTPYIPTVEETNTIIQETTFTDAQGTGIMRDVLFRYENNATNKEGVYFDMDGNGIKEKMLTWTDPNEWMVVKDLNHDGVINSGREVVGNNMTLQNGTKAADTIQALKTFDINHDGKVDTADNSGLAFWTDRNHNGLTDIGELEALGAAGAIQTIKLNPYQTLLSGYDNNHDGVINGSDALTNYLYIQTNIDNSVTLYLPDNSQARAMIAGYTGGESIQTAQGEKIIKTIQFYSGYEMSLNDELNGTDANETLNGSSRSETIHGKGGRDILDAGAGNDTLEGGRDSDKLIGGAGNDTYIFNRGDGKDLIIDSAGTDTIRFAEEITRDNLIIKSNGIDISIYLKDGTKSLTELTDQIIIKDWHTTGTVKTIAFSDGSTMDARNIVTMFSTDKNDTIYGTDNSETLIGGKGNDVLQGRGGNDTYLFARGDGKDTIIDSGGVDTLKFSDGISADNIIVKASANNNDLILAIKEDGKTFTELTDKVTLKNWFNAGERVENVTFSDGTVWNTNYLVNLQGTNENDTTHLLNTTSDVILNLQGGNDTVITASGNDILEGGKGNDILDGGEGNDVYLFNRGDGKDVVSDPSGSDRVQFGVGIVQDTLIVRQSGNDLIVALKEEGKLFDELSDVITLVDWNTQTKRIESFDFTDGTFVDVSSILQMLATDGDDSIMMPMDITIDLNLGAGNDVFESKQGFSERILGGSGNDNINTYGGDDILSGGTGDDILNGGDGNDTYLFDRGDGHDTVLDSAGNDVLNFGIGINQNDLLITTDGTDLVIALKEDGVKFGTLSDKIVIKNWNVAVNRVEALAFDDGSTMDVASIVAHMGMEEAETLKGTELNDEINGRGGDDTLEGGQGDDLYRFNRGNGHDLINDLSGIDTLAFGEGITKNDFMVKQQGNDIIIGIKEIGVSFENLADKIVVQDWNALSKSLERVTFSDGTGFSVEDIAKMLESNDTVYGTDQAESIETYGGYDSIYAAGGDDTIDAGADDDLIDGGSGNDVLIGGEGNDTLSGGTGIDIYAFNRGDGIDTINASWGNANDIVRFGSNITINDLMVRTADNANDLIVGISEVGKTFDELTDKIIIQNWFNQNDQIQRFELSDGSVLNPNDIVSLQAGTSGDDVIRYLDQADMIEGKQGNDILYGGGGDDTYIFSRGDGRDTIYDYTGSNNIQSGNDTIQLGSGITKDDLIVQKDGQDLLIGLKEEGVAFSDLSDMIRLQYWNAGPVYQIEAVKFNDGSIISILELTPTEGNDYVSFNDEANNIHALGGDDKVYGNGGDDILYGDSGNDYLDGGDGNDTLIGGTGNDILEDSYISNETYIFSRGDGQDRIYDYTGNDTLQFGEGIVADDLIIQRSGNDIILAFKEDGVDFANLRDKIRLGSWYEDRKIENILLSDGTVIVVIPSNDGMTTDDWDSVTLDDTDNVVHGLKGDDYLSGNGGDDVLYGDEGNDELYGRAGNDTLIGGAGNDYMGDWDGGDETYIFSRGDGQDRIYDYAGNDTLQFGEGIVADDLIFQKDGNDLLIGLKQEGVAFSNLSDTIRLKYWERGTTYRIETIKFSDNSSINLLNLAVGSKNVDHISLDNRDNFVHALEGDDSIYGKGGNDTLYGDDGDDYINSGSGDDTIIGGKGDDYFDEEEAGNDTYIFNRGDGKDIIYDYEGNDILQFGKGITAEDLIIQRDEGNLIVGLKEDGVAFGDLSNKLTLENWYYRSERIENILLHDGTPIDTAYLLLPTEGNDYLIATDEGETLTGLGGNDTLIGGAGDDILIGGVGDDYFDDDGAGGNDTYIFDRGDGKDIIHDYQGNDTLQFGEGITIDDIMVEVRNGDLLIGLKDADKILDELSDTIRISYWASNYYFKAVETIKLADGTTYNIAEYFNLSHSAPIMESPIVLDLNGNGITSTSSESNTVYFDYNADGLRERTAWSERGDALLAVDVNHDGIINDGSELFGDHTKLSNGSNATDGYTAMLQYDSNSDGKIDTSDEKFNDLLLWKDTNLDGQSSADELSTLSANGIVSIDLTPNPINIAENGNRISYETSFSMASGVNGIVRDLWFKTAGDDTIKSTDGEIADAGSFSDSFDEFTTDTTLEIDLIKSMEDSGIGSLTLQSRYTGSGLDGASAQTVFEGVGYTGTLSNVWLKSDTLDTQYTYNRTLSDDVKALPSIEGQGNVINLQEAMNEKSELASSVTEFQNLSETGNLADFEANIDAIIEGWALYDLSGESVNSTPPIVLDLDGDGVTSTSLAASSAYFDYDGDGRREHTAWSDEGDALLAVDLDNDGVITHGAELFGNHTIKADGTKAIDGYDAMAGYDTNGDNVLDASDTEFSKLSLWKDLNQNGKNDVGELSTLAENSISAINLSRTNGTTFTQVTEAGNTITNETNYTASNGEGAVRDVWFSYDGTDTIAYSNLSDSDEKKIAIVENFYGRRLNSEERNSVEVIAEVLNQYNALRYDTIAKIITDKLYGEGFPNCQFLHDALNNTLGRVVGGVASTTETLLAVNLLGALLKREHVGVLADIYPEYFSNPTISGLLAQSNIAIGFEEGALIGHIGNRYFGTSSAETLDFSALDGVRAYMSSGDDTIIGSKGIDEIVGGESNDVLDGNSGNDVLEGGQGDDVLKGASAQNVYRYAWGDGNDTIIDAGSDEYAPDTLRLSDLDISRVSIERVGEDMIIHIRDEEGELLTPFGDAFGTITIKDGYLSGKIEHFYFKDTRYTFDEVLAYVPADTNYYFVKADGQVIIDEKGGDDTLHFGEGITKESIIARIVGNDLIIGLAQEGRTFDTLSDKLTILNYTDAIEHFTFNDGSMMELSEMVEFAQAHLKITGSSESETLYGTNEGEMFNAGAGDDSIYGEGGDDTYTFGLGDGSDTIVDTAGNDTILLKDGVLASDVTLSLDGDDLLVSLNDGSRMRVVSWISSEGRIEHIKDTEGESVDFSAVLKPVVENTTLDGDEDTPFEGSLSVVDISGTPLIYAVATDPQNGTFALDTASDEWIYEPNANYNGSDSVVVSVTNGYGVTSTSTITLNVAGVNDAPIIEGDDITVTLRNILTTEGHINALDVDGDTLVYTIETQASHGTLSVDEQGKWSYTTIDGYDGQDSAVIRVSDGNGGSIDRILSFTIIDNTAPDAPIETTNTLQDIRILSGEVGAMDIDGDVLSYSVSTETSHGTISVNESGIWNYSATDGYMGTDSAVIRIDDANGGVIIQTLNFNVQVSAPSLANTMVNLFEDTSSTGTLNVTNPIGGALVYEVLNASSKGVFALGEQGSWSYNPNTHLNGEDSVTIKVTNTYGLSTTTTLNFAIEAVNDAPVTSEQENYILQDVRLMNGVIEASDIDGDTLKYTIHTAPIHGDISVNTQGEWSYTPVELYMGEDSAIISISDSKGGLVTKTITFDNRVSTPSVTLDSLTLSEDTARIESIGVINPIGGVLSFEVIGSPQNGTIRVDAQGVLEYTPSINYHGSDSVTMKVTNIYGLSDTRTIALDILSVNDNPDAPTETINTLQDIRILSGEVGATDIDGDILSYSVTTVAQHGILTIDENGTWNYSTSEGYMGVDSAIVTIDDNNGGVITQTLNFDVKVSAPTLADATSNLLEDNTSNGVFNVVNPIGGILTYEVLTATTNGDFTVDVDGNWSYNPSQDYNGIDSVRIKVTNEYGLSTTATLNLAIEAVNDTPVTTAEELFTLQDIRIQSGSVEASDIENDTLTYGVSTAATHGTLTINETGMWSYTATEGYMGIDTAVITVDDGNGGTATQTLTFDLKVSAPHLDDINAMMLEDSSITGTLNVLNPIGGTLSYEIISASTKGNFTLNAAGECVYTPAANANGNDSVIVKVTNAYGLSTTAILNVAIEAVNDAPIVVARVILNAVDEDSGVITITKAQLLANASDVDGDILDVLALSASAGVLVDNLDGTWSLTPAANYHGTIDLNYIVTDGQLNITASAAQVVVSVNDAPVLIQTLTAVTLNAGTSATGNILASDIDGDILSYSVTTAPAHGTLAIDNNGAWNYTAERYYEGQTSATINVNDAQGGSVATTLNFTNLMTPDWQYAYSGNAMTINDSDGIDALMMNNISMADLTFLQEGNNLRVDVKGKEDVILTDYFTSLPKGVESIQTKEGPISLIKQKLGATSQFFSSIWGSSQGDLISGSSSSETIYGGDGNDILFGGLGNDTLRGGSGNDILIGGEGSDSLFGGYNNDIFYGDAGDDTVIGYEGDDKIFGGLGNDTINGDEGNDLLAGGEGSNILRAGDGDDVYLFTKGANTTTVQDKSTPGFFFFGQWIGSDGGNDTVKFGEGISKNDISFMMSGHDLVLQYGTGELMTVKNQDNNDTKIEKFELNDGSYLTNTDMDQIIQQLNAYKADHGISITNNDQLRQNQAMMNIVASGWHQ